jgi:eukaryotic-like serine/threonine-protein kinase
MVLSPGTFLAGKYRVEKLVGQGAMGAVWQAKHALTERTVAIKVLGEDSRTVEARQHLLREARACGRIQHRNVIEVLDVGELDDGTPFLVMPMLAGETLEDRLDREGAIPEEEALDIALGVARALAAAHTLGIVHRDLKPGNIFLHREPGHDETLVKVLDFGISKILSREEASYTDAGRAVGSPAYMAPEQARGAADIDPRVDVWAFGVLVVEMLTGQLPFPGDTPYAIVGHILHGAMPDFDALCPMARPAVRELIKRCVVREPTQRLASARDVLGWLEAERGGPTSSRGSRVGLDPRRSVTSMPQFIEAPPRSNPGLARPISPLTATSSVLVAQDAPSSHRSSNKIGLAIGVALALGVGIGGVFAFGAGSPRTNAAGGAAAAPSAAAVAAEPEANNAPVAASASVSAEPEASPSAAASNSAAPTAPAVAPVAPAPTAPRPWQPAPKPYKPAPRTTGRVALPDSPG